MVDVSATETNVDRQERLRDIHEAADYLNVPYGWLQVKVTKRAVPHTRLGKHVRFTQEHLDQIIADGEQTVVAPTTESKSKPSVRRSKL